MDLCKSCGKQSLENVNHYGEEQCVCTSCGTVQKQETFSTAEAEETSKFVNNNNSMFNKSAPLSIQRESCQKQSAGLKQGKQLIADLASKLRLSSVMKQEVSMLYTKTVTHPDIKLKHLEVKKMLVAVCAYIVMRLHNWPVTVSNCCNAIGRNKVNFSRHFHKVLGLFNITISSASIEELVESFIQECRDLEDTQKELVKERVFEILLLARECWLTDGKTQRPIIIACIYLAWQSLFDHYKVSIDAFCHKMGFTCTTSIKSRQKELVKILCLMGNKLPWFEENYITAKNVVGYLEDILKYFNVLVNEVGSSARHVLTKPPKKQETLPTTTTTDSSDFSDGEIDSYIRSEKEVQMMEELRKHYSID